MGRPKKQNTADNQSQLSSITGIPLEHIQASKELGFVVEYNRWNIDKYKAWYESNKDTIVDHLLLKEEKETAKKELDPLKHERYLIAKIQREELEGKTLNKDKVISLFKSIYNAVVITLRNAEQDNPQLMVGKTVAEIQQIYRDTNDKVFGIIQKQLEGMASNNGTMGNGNNSNG